VINQRGQHFIVLNTEIRPDSIPEQIQAELMGRLKSMIGLTYEQSNPAESSTFPLSNRRKILIISKALPMLSHEISSGKVSKIVLARQLTFDVQRKLCPFSIAHGLRANFPDCHAFSLSAPNHGTWVGPVLKLLLILRGNKLRTEALAGSAPRGLSAGKDAHWGKTLLAREKEVHEHNLVIESIHRRLASVG
jgi:menaquinone-specific isochorismate synthase